MTTAPVTVVDRISFTCSVSPEQAAAYCRRKLPRWIERMGSSWGSPVYRFSDPIPKASSPTIEIPTMVFADYSRRMAELCDDLVALGCAERPSEILRGMGEERL